MVTKTAGVFSEFPVTFLVLVAGVVSLQNTVGLSETSVAFLVVDVASSKWSVDFAETCVVFSLADMV